MGCSYAVDDPERDMILVRDARGHELNPITDNGVGTKIGIDATAPYPRPWEFQRLRYARSYFRKLWFEE